MEEFCRLTNIPLETNRQDNPPGNTPRPPWIRPVRKKASSTARSSHSADSPRDHHSSPEPFSPSDFFSDPKQGGSFASGPPSTASGTSSNQQIPSPSNQYNMGGPSPGGQGNGSGGTASAFGLDPLAGAGMDIIREDSTMFMSSNDMMAFFSDGGVDINSLFSPDTFLHQQPGSAALSPPSAGGSGAGIQSQQPGGQNGFMKMAGLVTSP
ncbi:hypothetical protein NMY22_g8685 [Coprinellus aureogranulatus]|nr:hypothetical protein NMY22_g8685 [Coprinellus aureogranulatus]